MAITDKFMHASSGTRPEPTTLTAQKSLGASTLTADDLTGWATDTPTPFVIFQLDSMGNEVDGTRSDWVGIVVGNTITQLTLTAGTDDTYPAGSAVIAATTAEWGDRIVDGLLVSHDQDGTLKNNSVSIAKIQDSAVTASKLATSAITLGYNSSTSNQTVATTSATTLTGTSVTATLPGSRNVRVSVDIPYATSGAASNFVTLDLLNGTTVIRSTRVQVPLNGSTGPIKLDRVLVAPTAGSQTYSARITQDSATGVDYIGLATSPIYLLVEAI